MSAKTPPRLGRGLAALMGEPADTATATQLNVRTIAVASLDPSPFQPRMQPDPQQLAELATSIRQHGVLQPLLLRPHPQAPGRYQIIAGERRWRAAQVAELHEVPAMVVTLNDRDALAAALVENLQRQDLNAVEEAEGYRKLLQEFGLTQDRLAEAVGKSRSHVGNMLRLLQLPVPVLDAVREGRLSAGHARALLTHPDPRAAAEAVIAGGLNVRQTEALTHQRPTPARAEPAGRDPDLDALARQLSSQLGLKVDIAFDGARGTVRIFYRDLDQLDGIVSLLTPR